jgi:hypothetical protein
MKKVLLLVAAFSFAFTLAACDPTEVVVEDITVTLAGLENVEVEEETVLNVLDGITAVGSDAVDYSNLITVDSDDCTITDGVLDTSVPGSCTIIVSVVVDGKFVRDTFDVNITAKPLPPAPDVTVMEWDFEEEADLDNWEIYTAGAGSIIKSLEDGAMKLVTTSGGQRYETRLDYMGVPLEQGELYKISFKMKSDVADKKVHINFGELLPSDPWFTPFKPEGIDVVTLSTEWQTFEFTFLMELDNQNGGPLFEMGNMEGSEGIDATIWVDDLRISGGSGEDLSDPTIEGADDVTIFIGDVTEFDPLAGVTAMDLPDVDLTSEIILSGDTVDVTVAGTYKLYYVVYDEALNYVRVARTVVVQLDEQAPMVYGIDAVEVEVNTSFDALEGVTAMDNRDGDATDDIVVGGDVVDLTTAGDYTVTYTVEDSLGNSETYERVVTVVAIVWHPTSLLPNGDFDVNPWYVWAADWNSTSVATTFDTGAAVLDIADVGAENWNIQLVQEGFSFVENAQYRLTFDAMSTVARDMNVKLIAADGTEYTTTVMLTDTMATYTVDVTFAQADSAGKLSIELGGAQNGITTAVASVVTFDNFMLEDFDGSAVVADTDQMMYGDFEFDHLLGWSSWTADWFDPAITGALSEMDNMLLFTYSGAGTDSWNHQINFDNIAFEYGKTYKLTFDAKSDVARDIQVNIYDGSLGHESGAIALTTEMATYTHVFMYVGDADAKVEFQLGKLTDNFDGTMFYLDNVVIEEAEFLEPIVPTWEGFGGTTLVENVDGSVAITYDITTEWWWDFSAQHLNLEFDGSTFNAIDFTFTGVAGQNYLFKVEYQGGAKEYGMAATGAEDVLTLDLTDLTEEQLSSINKVIVFANGQGQVGTVTVAYATTTIVPSTDTLADMPNQDFTDTDISGWGTEGTLTLSHDAAGYLVVNVTELGANPWSQNLGFSNQKVISGNTYEVTFVIKTEFAAGRDVTFFAEDTDNGYAKYFETTETLTDSFQTFTFSFTPTANNSDTKLGIFVGNTSNAVIGNVIIDSITITETEPTT